MELSAFVIDETQDTPKRETNVIEISLLICIGFTLSTSTHPVFIGLEDLRRKSYQLYGCTMTQLYYIAFSGCEQ
jgi:hypothetical protein